MDATSDGFFEDTAMIGIASAQPGYRFCWILNNHFEINFGRDPEQKNILLRKKDKQKNEQAYNFPIYQYDLPNSTNKYLLYKLKDGSESLLPETKHMDYLWLIQTGNAEEDALYIVNELKNIPDVQLAQVLLPDQLKNLNNLLV
ncbi:MAG: IPExxxVDY family protein [Flavipsychrobacter sp.]|nr:IPExxxVDY family protein [Flavipsychrobacter sp.]